jgi:hypothetical protein
VRVRRRPPLLVARREDLGAVVGADVVALAVLGRRVVDLEEELEDVPVGDPRGIEDDLNGLGVAGMVGVGRVLVLAAGVADASGDHPVAVAKQLCISQKQPPARIAVSVLSVMAFPLSTCRFLAPGDRGAALPQPAQSRVASALGVHQARPPFRPDLSEALARFDFHSGLGLTSGDAPVWGTMSAARSTASGL